MLSRILGVIQEFERTRGSRPTAVCLNTRHMLELMDECADLFDRKQPLALGVRFVVVADSEAPQPKALAPPARPRAVGVSDPDVLLAWSTGRRNFA